MVFRSIAIVAALSLGGGVAAAQTVADPQVNPDVLRQIQSFESVLAGAITQAGQRVTDRALQVIPDVKLGFEASPLAKGFWMPTGEGMFFMVEVPGIQGTSEMLWSRLFQLMQQQNASANANPNLPRVANPLPAGVDPTTFMTSPGKEYADYTRMAIVEAMLDAITLSLKDGQVLTVSVGSSPNPTNPLAPGGRRLYLTIKAEDLSALRAKTISREEARARIIEKRY